MRIALYHNLPSGGAKRAIYEWTQRLAVDHQIDVFTLSSADHTYCDIRPIVHRHKVFPFEPRNLFDSPWGRLNQWQRWQDLRDLIQLQRKIAEQINQVGYDVAFTHGCQFSTVPAILQFLQLPSVYYLHEAIGHNLWNNLQRPYSKNGAWRPRVDRIDPLIKLYENQRKELQSASLKLTTKLIANSQFTQQLMKKVFGLDTTICHYGVSTDEFRPLPEVSREGFLLSVGELTPRKGFPFLIESLALIPIEERPELRLACNMVDAKEIAYVEHLAAEHNLELRILTRLSACELAEQYNQAKMVVYAPIAEPFGLVPLEAMACGTAVIGVREGGVPESVVHDHTGLLVERDAQKFASAIQELLRNPNLAEAYGRNGRQHVLKNWTWDRSVAQIEEQLYNIAQRQNIPYQSQQ